MNYFKYFIFSILLTSCGNTSRDGKNGNDSAFFYPVTDFLQYQIHTADSLAEKIILYTTTGTKKDTVEITRLQFRNIAGAFTEINIADPGLQQFYRQSFFLDITTGSYIYSYVCDNSSLPLRTMDILLDTATTVVRRIVITKNFVNGDSTIIEKMGWKTDHSFFINRIILPTDNAEVTEQLEVNWTLKK